ncbi:type IV secretion system protein [Lysobacter pythonis]|uniref:Type IV secretion system protein n=1 Tax=Solilutibacter pythonis TaxID=2483112 RepID=A0A3M2HMQ3_9GAMM|nr:type IV secretion system protein [Lysobacter pythonis]RMH90991.1 type IV secretion system protein [Lysobacter pythonis]
MDSVAQWAFFKLIFDFLDKEIATFQDNLLFSMGSWVMGIIMLVVTMWIMFQGYLIVTGRSREPMMALVTHSLRVVLIVFAAGALTAGKDQVYTMLSSDVPRHVTKLVTGKDKDASSMIDGNLDKMAAAFALIDLLAPGDNDRIAAQKTRALWFTGVGVAGPAVVGGALLLVYKVALALFIGFGPLFILSLLSNSTKQLFSKWLYYGIGTMFSLAVLAFMVAVAMKMIAVVAGVFILKYQAAAALGTAQEGISSLSLQQGGLGLILTIMLITCPPMAAMFFQGMLGNVSTMYSQFGVTGKEGRDAAGNPVGGGGYKPAGQEVNNTMEGKGEVKSMATLNYNSGLGYGENKSTSDQIKNK